MTRLNMFEILDSKYNIKKEFDKINNLFETPLITYPNNNTTLGYCMGTIENAVDEMFLILWKQRKSYFNCSEMKEDIGFDINNYDYANIILTLEYYINLINLMDIKIKRQQVYCSSQPKIFILTQNIDILIEHLNYEKLYINEEEKVLLVPKCPQATAVAEISPKETALAILMYNHASLQGDLSGKRNILNSISREYETLLNNPVEGYNDFYKKTNLLLNNLHIRHDNKTKENNKNTVIDIDNAELEKWYDELYQLLLFCILINENLDRKNKVSEFLKTIKNKK